MHIPFELVHDSLLFLPRNELEKCQLVCKRWKSLVDTNGHHMALRKLANLAIWEVDNDAISLASEHKYPCISWQNLINSSGPNFNRIKSLKYCIFNVCAAQTEIRLILRALKQLYEICGCKINIFDYACSREPIESIPEILNYIITQKLRISENQDIRSIFHQPIHIPTPPMKICILIDLKSYLFEKEKLFDLIESKKLPGANRYSLKFFSYMKWGNDYFTRLVNIYMREKEPKQLIHSLRFIINDGALPPIHFFNWLNLQRTKIVHSSKEIKNCRKEIYQIRKYPDVIIKVIVVKNKENLICSIKLKVEELKEKVSYKSLKFEEENLNIRRDGSDGEQWNPAMSWCSIM